MTAPSHLTLPQRRPVSQAVDVALSATAEELTAALSGPDAALGQEEALRLLYDWEYWARPEQLAPPGDWWRIWAIVTGRSWGKAADVNCLIPMSHGWKRLRDVKNGDEVLDEAQNVCRVVRAHPIRSPKKCYRVHFSDGESLVAGAEHLWAVKDALHSDVEWQILNTKQISLWCATQDNKPMLPAVPGFGHRWITKAELSIPIASRCLTVDSASALYLIGPTYIPTHNTRTGAEWIRQRAYDGKGPIAIVGKTAADCRDIMVLGPAGLMACSPPWFKPVWMPSKRRIEWPNGTYGITFGGDEPDQLRGVQNASAWADEIAKWSAAQEAFSNLEMGMRVGADPRVIITTTPRPIRLIKELLVDPHVFVQRGHTYENRANVPASFIERIEHRYAGTRLGRQELAGEVLEDVPGALWQLRTIDDARVKISDTPALRQIVVGVDPSAKDYDPEQSEDDREGSECGIIVAGVGGHEDHGYVLHDGSDNLSPREWAERVVELFYKFRANWVVAERNNGGGMVRETIHAVDDTVPVLLVWASTGKDPRAEPVSLLYEQGRVHHVGTLADLEDQMCGFVPREKKRPPKDRMDALVWAIKHLMLGDDRIPHYDPTKHRISTGRRTA